MSRGDGLDALQRPSGPLRFSPFPSQAGDVVDVTPLSGESASIWLLLADDGRLTRFDADDHTAQEVGRVVLPKETPQANPYRGQKPQPHLYASANGRFAAVVNDFGRYGKVLDLRTAATTQTLDGGDHHSDTVPFSFAFTEEAGRTLLVHRTAWNRLDISDAATGRLLTGREVAGAAHRLDYFHGALTVSPHGTRIADDGWVWHPHGVPTVWNLRNWIRGRTWESEDGQTRKELAYRDHYWNNPQCWIDERRIAISGIGGIGSPIKTLRAGVRVFDAVRRRELTELLGVRGALFAADGTLFAAAPDGLQIWNPDTGEQSGAVPGFVPAHHHRGAGELAASYGGGLTRWRLGPPPS